MVSFLVVATVCFFVLTRTAQCDDPKLISVDCIGPMLMVDPGSIVIHDKTHPEKDIDLLAPVVCDRTAPSMPDGCYGYNPFEHEEVKSILFLRYDNTTMTEPPRHQLFREQKHGFFRSKGTLDYAWCLDLRRFYKRDGLRCFTHAPAGLKLNASALRLINDGKDLMYDLQVDACIPGPQGETGPTGPSGPMGHRGLQGKPDESCMRILEDHIFKSSTNLRILCMIALFPSLLNLCIWIGASPISAAAGILFASIVALKYILL